MVEHELGVVERLCQRVVVMAQGKVISEGTMEAVRKDKEVLSAYLVG
jgi:ABC-type branched-subunit amino acid transport system ATPase component